MITESPIVSCICITNRRIHMLQRAISCFRHQSYKNSELIVSFPQSDNLTRYIVQRTMANQKIKIVAIERKDYLSLGAARNQAIEASSGDYICTWDDDDWYHPERLNIQVSLLHKVRTQFNACVLNQLILFDCVTDSAFLSFLYPWENTLLFSRTAFPDFRYSHKDMGEDSHITDHFSLKHQLYHIGGYAELYIYIYHRSNTWGYAHFESFIERSTLLNSNISSNISKLITQIETNDQG